MADLTRITEITVLVAGASSVMFLIYLFTNRRKNLTVPNLNSSK